MMVPRSSAATEHPILYVLDPLAPFPPSWCDHIGNITVMTNPVKGYVMVRRPGAMPFVLAVGQLLNAEKHPVHGPFTLIASTKRVRRPA